MKKPEARHRSEDTTSSTDCVKLHYEEYLRDQRGFSKRTIYHCGNLFGRGDEVGGLVQELHGLGCTCSGGPDRFIVSAQHGCPIRDILGMLQSSRDLQLRAEERRVSSATSSSKA